MMINPENLTDLPGLHIENRGDLLSEVLRHIRLSGEIVECIVLPLGVSIAPDKIKGACLFFLASGNAELRLGPENFEIASGDLVVLPEGVTDGHIVASSYDAEFLMARFHFETHSLHGMVLVLPQVVHISKDIGTPWLDGISRFLRIEALDDQPGAVLMVSRLIDLIVIRALRTWAQQGRTLGWLGGLADPRLAKSLAALHANPLRRWNIEELAKISGMSKSSFCHRFQDLVGKSPLRYHNELRLGLARTMIIEKKLRVGEVGLKVGYESEAAFSRAYKALFGKSPALDRLP